MAAQGSEATKAVVSNGEVKQLRPTLRCTFQDKGERIALLFSGSGVGHWRFRRVTDYYMSPSDVVSAGWF